MKRSLCFAIAVAIAFGGVVSAQSPHGAQGSKPQPGANVNAAAGVIADPLDPAALVKTDILLQRQNETVIAASTRNSEHILAAANDYRFVDFPQDVFPNEQGFFTRLLAKLFFRPSPPKTNTRAAAGIGVGAWTGVYRSCDRGATWVGSAVPGSPLDESPASLQSPLKAFSNYAAATHGGHAETTDPVIVAGPNGLMHLFVLGFVRLPDGRAIDGRMYHVLYSNPNNREGGLCHKYEFTVEMDRSANYISSRFPSPFLDKPAAAIDKDGTLYVAYTVFDDANNSRIVVARSTNGGVSWTRTMPLLSVGFLRNHGATVTVDPQDSTVFVAWRVFYQDWPLMVISRSPNGKTFLPPSPISDLWPAKNIEQIVTHLKGARLAPFDQFNHQPGQPVQARSLAFPQITAGVMNGRTRLYAVWQERADVNPNSPTFGLPSATGSPRVMISMSENGLNWTQRRAVDAGPRTEHLQQANVGPMTTRASGPQLQPAVNISGTVNPQLLVAYYEARDEIAQPFESNFVSGIERRMDVRVARVNPVTLNLLAPSVQVSQYLVKPNTAEAQLAETAPGWDAVSRKNETLYGGGFKSFFGDYMTLASSSTLVNRSRWDWDTEPSPSLLIFTDHRDVKFPLNANAVPDIHGRWDLYTPVTSPQAACSNVGMRNANPYMTEIGGVIAGVPHNFKPLNIQRAFATYVANQTPLDRYFRLQVIETASGPDASFSQFSFTPADNTVDIKVFGNSRHNQTVWVNPFPSSPNAQVRIRVEEITAINGSVKPDGLRTSIVLNPDPDNDALTPVPAIGPPFDTDLSTNSETHEPSLSAPKVKHFSYHYPGVSTPQLDTPQIDSRHKTPQIDSPQLDTPQIDSRGTAAPQIDSHLSTPQLDTPQIDSPQIDSVAPDNGTDVTYAVSNGGTTTTNYKVAFNVPNVQTLLTNGSYQFIVIVSKTSLSMGADMLNGVCTAVVVPEAKTLASIPITSAQVAQLAAIDNPQIDSTSPPDIVTVTLAPVGGVAGQNLGGNDAHSTFFPDEVNVTLRAIRRKTVAEMIAQNLPFFEPEGVVIKVESTSTNVINGVVQPAGTEPSAVAKPDLRVEAFAPADGGTVAPGGSITFPNFAVRNAGGATHLDETSIRVGYYLSTDQVITAADTLLHSVSFGDMEAGETRLMTTQALTIPASVVPGAYYVGILLDRLDVVGESNELNNFASQTVMVAIPLGCLPPPAGLVAWWPGDGNLDDIVGDNDGSTNESHVTFDPGKVGPAITLPAPAEFFSHGYVLINEPSDFDIELGSFPLPTLRPALLTVDFWFKSDRPLNATDTQNQEVPLVVKLNTSDNSTIHSKGYDFFYEFGALRFGLPKNVDGTNYRVVAQMAMSFAAGTWHHVAGTFDGTLQKLYVDGALVRTVNWASPSPVDLKENPGAGPGPWSMTYYPGITDILIGRSRSSAFPSTDPVEQTYFFDGQIDEIELFNRALSDTEVADLYNALGKCRRLALTANHALGVVGSPLLLTATMVPAINGSLVRFMNGENLLATVPTNANGVATYTAFDLPFETHHFQAVSDDTPARAQPSDVLTLEMLQRFATPAAFDAAVAGETVETQNFNVLPLGTSFKNPNTALIPGVVDITSAWSFSTPDRLEVFDAGYAGAERALFGYSTGFDPRTYEFGGFGSYHLFSHDFPGIYDAYAFDIVGQDPSATPVRMIVNIDGKETELMISNPGSATTNNFIGLKGTKPISAVLIYEGCTSSEGTCVNSPIKLDNFKFATNFPIGFSITPESLTFSLDGTPVNISGTVTNMTASDQEEIDIQHWIDQGNRTIAAAGWLIQSASAPLGTVPANSTVTLVGGHAANAGFAVGAGMTPGPATWRVQLRQFTGQGTTVLRQISFPITLIDPTGAGTITSVSPPNGAPGEGFLVVRGAGFPNPAASIAIVSDSATTANGFLFQAPSTTSAYWVRLPIDFPLGPATIQISQPSAFATSNAFPITVTATPGTPVLTNVFRHDGSSYVVTTTAFPGSQIHVQADGIDTTGCVVRFQQGGTTTDMANELANSDPTTGLKAQVTVPSGLAPGPVSVSIRQGSSAFSTPVTLTILPQ